MTDEDSLVAATASLRPSLENAVADTPLDPDSSSRLRDVGILQAWPGNLDQTTTPPTPPSSCEQRIHQKYILINRLL